MTDEQPRKRAMEVYQLGMEYRMIVYKFILTINWKKKYLVIRRSSRLDFVGLPSNFARERRITGKNIRRPARRT